MRTLKQTSNFLHILLSFLAVLSFLPLPSALAGMEKEVAWVMRVVPEVEVKYAGEEKWLAAWEGMELREGDEVRCLETGSMDISFYDGAVVSGTPNSRFFLTDVTRDQQQGLFKRSIRLVRGAVAAILERRRGKQMEFLFKTPSAVAGVRGTRLVVSALDDETSQIAVFDGAASVYSESFPSDVKVLEAGYQIDVRRGKGLESAHRLSDEMQGFGRELTRLEEQRARTRDSMEDFYRKWHEEKRREMGPREMQRPEGSQSLYEKGKEGEYLNERKRHR